MDKDKLNRLAKYAVDLKERLSAPLPAKQKNREKQYREFLSRDLVATVAKIDALKLQAPAEPAKKA